MTFNTPVTRIAGAVATATIVGALAIGTAAPASAAPLDTPGSSATAPASAFTPTPGITGLRFEGGRTYLVGTGVPSGVVTVDTGRLGVLTRSDDDGKWKADVTSNPFGTLVVQQAQNGVRSAEVRWTVDDGPVAPGPGEPTPPRTVAKPVVEGVRAEGGRRWLVGTGIPGASITVTTSSSGGQLTRVAEDGTWKVDVTTVWAPSVEVQQASDGQRSEPVYHSLLG